MEIPCEGKKAAEIYEKMKTKLSDYQMQGKLTQLSRVDFNDAAREAMASGTGFKSRIKCEDGKVIVDLDLNFLLKPMQRQIEDAIRGVFQKALSETG